MQVIDALQINSWQKLKFKIQFLPLFLHRPRQVGGQNEKSHYASKKKISRSRMACIFYFSRSIGFCHYQPLAMVNSYHSFRDYLLCLGNGHRLIRRF